MNTNIDYVPEFKTLPDVIVVRKSATETVNNSAVIQNDDELFALLAANAVYVMELTVITESAANADIQFGWGYPVNATVAWGGGIVAADGITSAVKDNLTRTDTVACEGQGAADLRTFKFFGTINVGNTAGTLQLKWAQGTAQASDTKVHADSSLILRKIYG